METKLQILSDYLKEMINYRKSQIRDCDIVDSNLSAFRLGIAKGSLCELLFIKAFFKL